jgi:hypothetical protein
MLPADEKAQRTMLQPQQAVKADRTRQEASNHEDEDGSLVSVSSRQTLAHRCRGRPFIDYEELMYRVQKSF